MPAGWLGATSRPHIPPVHGHVSRSPAHLLSRRRPLPPFPLRAQTCISPTLPACVHMRTHTHARAHTHLNGRVTLCAQGGAKPWRGALARASAHWLLEPQDRGRHGGWHGVHGRVRR